MPGSVNANSAHTANNVTDVIDRCKERIDELFSNKRQQLDWLIRNQVRKGADFHHRSDAIQKKFHAAIESLRAEHQGDERADQTEDPGTLLSAQKAALDLVESTTKDLIEEAKLELELRELVAFRACSATRTGGTLDLQSGSSLDAALGASTTLKVMNEAGLTEQFEHFSLSGGSAIPGCLLALGTTIDDGPLITKVSGEPHSAISDLDANLSAAASIFLLSQDNESTFRNFCAEKGVEETRVNKLLGRSNQDLASEPTDASESNAFTSHEMLTFSDLKLLHECFPERFKTVSITVPGDDYKRPGTTYCADTHGDMPIALAAVASSVSHARAFSCTVNGQELSFKNSTTSLTPKQTQSTFSFKSAPITPGNLRSVSGIRSTPPGLEPSSQFTSRPIARHQYSLDPQESGNSIRELFLKWLERLGIQTSSMQPFAEDDVDGVEETQQREQEDTFFFLDLGELAPTDNSVPDSNILRARVQVLEALVHALRDTIAQEQHFLSGPAAQSNS